MSLTNDDLKKVKKVVTDVVGIQLDTKLGKRLNKIQNIVANEVVTQLDSRLGKGLSNFEELINDIIDGNENIVKKEDIKLLPTTDLFLSKMDELMGEVKTFREEQSMLSNRVSIHSDQIDRIEKHVGLPAYSF